MKFYLAPALVALRDEVNERWPSRDKSSDGWVGDTSHAARPSDHNPDWNSNGVVRAIDIDVDDNNPNSNLAKQVVAAAVGDNRVWYVIHQFPGKVPTIWSRTYDWEPRRYTGSNPHNKHVHISVRKGGLYENDTDRWLKPKIRTLPISLSAVRIEFFNAIEGKRVQDRLHVRRLQRALNLKYPDLNLKVDGKVGDKTLDAWGLHERGEGGHGRLRVPDRVSLEALVAPRYKMKA